MSRVFPPPSNKLRAAVRALRPFQWVKNLLIFVPGFTSHLILDWPTVAESACGFLAFSLCASGVYIINDLLDLQEDRRHASKKDRPFASGQCSILMGAAVAAACLILSLAVTAFVDPKMSLLLTLYICLTTLYSLYLKRLLLVDVFSLALLYTLRIIAGHVATGIPFSLWLLSFAFFLFLSLAFAKRATELIKLGDSGGKSAPGRSYSVADLGAITTAGITSGFLSSVVLALYLSSDSVRLLYRQPIVLWAVLPLLLYYVTRI